MGWVEPGAQPYETQHSLKILLGFGLCPQPNLHSAYFSEQKTSTQVFECSYIFYSLKVLVSFYSIKISCFHAAILETVFWSRMGRDLPCLISQIILCLHGRRDTLSLHAPRMGILFAACWWAQKPSISSNHSMSIILHLPFFDLTYSP